MPARHFYAILRRGQALALPVKIDFGVILRDGEGTVPYDNIQSKIFTAQIIKHLLQSST